MKNSLEENNSKISFFAVSGLEEVGRNCYVYKYQNNNKKEAIIIDLGVGFRDIKLTTASTFMPDLYKLIEMDFEIKGLLITHAHEDHIGAIPYLASVINFPIYATKFTAAMIKDKLSQVKRADHIQIKEVDKDKPIQIGSFRATWHDINHSVVDNNMILLETPKGNILHSGDFKVDVNDQKLKSRLEELKNKDIKYLFCDSTNANKYGKAGLEEEIYPDLKYIISNAPRSVWITLFASNVNRLQLIIKIAKELKKKIVLHGRSLQTYIELASKFNLIDSNIIIDDEQASTMEDKDLIKLLTGSQGEQRSALYNALILNSSRVNIHEEDIVIFSSKVIPGNELRVNRFYNILAERDISFFTDYDYKIHVSGHGKKDDLKYMFESVKPEYIIPIHGEVQHLKSNKEYANELGFKSKCIFLNKEIELFNPKGIKIIDDHNFDKLTYENNRVVYFSEDFFRERTKLFYEGCVFVFVNINKQRKLVNFELDSLGILTHNEIQEVKRVTKHYTDIFLQHQKDNDLDNITEEIRIIVKRYIASKLTSKPIIKVQLNQI